MAAILLRPQCVDLEPCSAAATKDAAGRDDLPAVSSPPIKLRYSLGPAAETLAPTAGKLGYLEIDICRLRTMLLMSSMTNLVDLIEDEVIPDAMPMRILVRKVDITLKVRHAPNCTVSSYYNLVSYYTIILCFAQQWDMSPGGHC